MAPVAFTTVRMEPTDTGTDIYSNVFAESFVAKNTMASRIAPAVTPTNVAVRRFVITTLDGGATNLPTRTHQLKRSEFTVGPKSRRMLPLCWLSLLSRYL